MAGPLDYPVRVCPRVCGSDSAAYQPPEIRGCPNCGATLCDVPADLVELFEIERLTDLAKSVALIAFSTHPEIFAHAAEVVDYVSEISGEVKPETRMPFWKARAVAWLHDVVEDSEVSGRDLRDVGFPQWIVGPVQMLTRPKALHYPAYIDRLVDYQGEEGHVARIVKLADASHNLARCEVAWKVPRYERLAEERYRPVVDRLRSLVVGE